MRTTLTLDDDVADFLKEKSKLLGVPFKQIVNETIRNGMSGSSDSGSSSSRFVVKPHEGEFLPGIDVMKLNQFVDELELDDFISKTGK
jgi:hypothetical protein